MKADLKAMSEIELIRYERELGEEMTRVRNRRWEILEKNPGRVTASFYVRPIPKKKES